MNVKPVHVEHGMHLTRPWVVTCSQCSKIEASGHDDARDARDARDELASYGWTSKAPILCADCAWTVAS